VERRYNVDASRRSFVKTGAIALSTVAVCNHGIGNALAAATQDGPVRAKGYALFSKDGKFTPYEFERHAVGDHDVQIQILYAGIRASRSSPSRKWMRHTRRFWQAKSNSDT
jgi:hypothetical protein